MPRTGLSHQELKLAVLDAAEATIRRHGIEKSRLVDVAKSVGVNHALLYRLFADKEALMDAVSERWLGHIDQA
jgi:AcrR family transcriptional regulator